MECRKRPGLQQLKLPTSFQLVRLVGCGLKTVRRILTLITVVALGYGLYLRNDSRLWQSQTAKPYTLNSACQDKPLQFTGLNHRLKFTDRRTVRTEKKAASRFESVVIFTARCT